MHRRSDYTLELAEKICESLSLGKTLRETCAADGMPSETTVRRWSEEDREGFRAIYARAREAQAHALYDEILETARNAPDAALGRLRVDSLKWAASKMLPKVYGEKIQHTGADDKPLFPAVTVLFGSDGSAKG